MTVHLNESFAHLATRGMITAPHGPMLATMDDASLARLGSGAMATLLGGGGKRLAWLMAKERARLLAGTTR
ncbi:hypothetical protein [Magnetofaba australis]|uniref:hypothetical protein n=1 Tax=Magnetofaba australis TaxID=1472297 RepID=UPI000A19C69A|nr:hypothetical protein [Magnetofaba australis]